MHYKISDTTRTSHPSTKQFFSSGITNTELTKYFSKKLAQYITKEYVIVYRNSLPTNVENLDEQLDNYTQQETDTSIVFHAVHVTKRDPFSELVAMCSDTDVLVLLLHYFEMTSSSTIFKTTEPKYILRKTHENLTPDSTPLVFMPYVDVIKQGNILVIQKRRAGRSL